MTKTSRRRMPLAVKKSITGYLYILPFLLGLVVFFAVPIFQSLQYSLSTVAQSSESGLVVKWLGLANYRSIFLTDAEFIPNLLATLGQTALEIVLILVISFFIALLLHMMFKGPALARAIFFLPVIITSGVLLGFEANTMLLVNKAANAQELAQAASGYFSQTLYEFLRYDAGLDSRLVNIILEAIGQIYAMISRSGIQILIYLSALQSIDRSLKEAANVDGATGWEFFWKVTFPMVSSYIVVCFVYTTIDSFTNSTNSLMTYIKKVMFDRLNFAHGSAMSWVYFLVIGLAVALIMGISSRVVYYEE